MSENESDDDEPIFSSLPAAAFKPREGERARPQLMRPMVFAAAAYAIGILVGYGLALPFYVWGIALGVAVASLVVDLVRHRRERGTVVRPGLIGFVALGLAGAIAGGSVAADDAADRAVIESLGRIQLVRVEGVIAERPVAAPDTFQIILRDVAISAPGMAGAHKLVLGAAVYFPRETETKSGIAAAPIVGSRVGVWGKPLAAARAGFPGAADPAALLRARGLAVRISAESPEDLTVIEERGEGHALAMFIDAVRGGVEGRLRAILPEGAFRTACVLLLGDREGMTEEQVRDYKRTGLVHLLSVSGLHTAYILAVCAFLARFFMLPRPWGSIAAGAGVLFYALLTDMQPPVVRAALMSLLLLAAFEMGRWSSVLSALAASAFLTLAIDARNLFRADWQLSYLCVGSLTLLAPAIYEIIPTRRSIQSIKADEPIPFWRRLVLGWVWLPFAVVASVQMGLLPLQARLVGDFSVVGLLIQPLAIGLSGGIIVLSAIAGVVGAIPGVGSLLGALITPASDLLGWLVAWGASPRWASMTMPPLPDLALPIYYALLLVGPHLMRGRGPQLIPNRGQRIHMLARVMAFAAFVIVWPLVALPAPRGFLDFYVVDVGQGDGLVVRFPDGRAAVIDAGKLRGGGADRQTVTTFLHTMGVSRAEFVVASHADADHIGGMAGLIDSVDIGLFVHGPDTNTTDQYRMLGETLHKHAVRQREVWAGEEIEGFEPVRIRVVNPFRGSDNNDASVSLVISFGETDIMTTGDISEVAEGEILRAGFARDVEVLKVAHHGSAGSSSERFLDAVRPEVALISCGAENHYGHPTPAALGRLCAAGAAVLRTDRNGSLMIRTDGRRIAIFHFVAP